MVWSECTNGGSVAHSYSDPDCTLYLLKPGRKCPASIIPQLAHGRSGGHLVIYAARHQNAFLSHSRRLWTAPSLYRCGRPAFTDEYPPAGELRQHYHFSDRS